MLSDLISLLSCGSNRKWLSTVECFEMSIPGSYITVRLVYIGDYSFHYQILSPHSGLSTIA